MLKHIYFLCNKKNEYERYDYIIKQILQINLEKFSIFSYCWGNQITEDVKTKYCKTDNSMKMYPHNRNKKIKPLSNAEISLFINHIKCLKKIREKYSNGYFIIFESDVIFENNFNKKLKNLLLSVKQIKDWDIINIGEGCRKYMKKYLGYPKQNPIVINNNIFYKENINSCTEGLLWNYKAICKFLNYFEKEEDICGPIDAKIDYFSGNIEEFNIYWCEPPLVYQGSMTGKFKSFLQEKR